MNKSGPPTRLAPSEYEAIEQAMMETERGRWFLSQFAEKNRRKDTQVVLEAISKLESTVSTTRSQPEADRIKMDLVEMSQAISRTRNEIANLKLPEHDGGNLLDATEELDSIVSTTERATNKILQAAEDIQETAWTIREDGSFEAPCARIDTDVTDIYTACSFQDITGQRTQKVVHILRYLEARINAMVSIWGLDQEEFGSGNEDGSKSVSDNRPDAHLLNGPQLDKDALKQDDIDDVMDEAGGDSNSSTIGKNENQAEIDITAKFIAQTAHEVEALTIQAVEVAEELIHAAEAISEEAEEEPVVTDAVAITQDDVSTAELTASPMVAPSVSTEVSDLEEETNPEEKLHLESTEPDETSHGEEEAAIEETDLSPTDAFRDIADSPELAASELNASVTDAGDLAADEGIELSSLHTEETERQPSEEEAGDIQPHMDIQDNGLQFPEESPDLPESLLVDNAPTDSLIHDEIPSEPSEITEDEALASSPAEMTDTTEQIASEDDQPLITDEIEGADSIINALAQELDAIKDLTVEAAEDTDREALNLENGQTSEEPLMSSSQEENAPDNQEIVEDTQEDFQKLAGNVDETPPPLPDSEENDLAVISKEQASFVEHFSRIHKELQTKTDSSDDDGNIEANSQSSVQMSDPEETPESSGVKNIAEAETETETETETDSKPGDKQSDKGYKSSDWVGHNLYLLLEEEENEKSSEEDTMSSQLRNLPASAKTAAFE